MKTSLGHKVADELKLPFVSIDLFLANNDAMISKRILQGVAVAISEIVPPSIKVLEMVQKLFQGVRVSIGVKHFNIEASFDSIQEASVDQIFDALSALDGLAKKQKKKIIFFIDEFQDITNAQSAKAIQGAIRHVAQGSNNIVFLFSGSNRHLLLKLFDDSHLPLYMLCDKLRLERIHSKDFYPYIQSAAKKRWGKEISESAFHLIMKLTELHPFYVNMLCNQLWEGKTLPKTNCVEAAWQHCYEAEERRFIAELAALSVNQQNVIRLLAMEPSISPTGQEFIGKLRMANSSVAQALKVLAEKDMTYVVREEDEAIPVIKIGQTRVLDPLLAYALRQLG